VRQTRVRQLLDKASVIVYDAGINGYAVSQGMGGFSATFLKLERAIGFQDAGATSVWLIMRSIREFAER
jgi:dihydroxyacetone kinase